MQYLHEGGNRIAQLWGRIQDSRHFPSALRRRENMPAILPPVEPEVSQQRPGLFTESGSRLFYSPPQEAIAALQAVDPRIEYFRFHLPSPEQGQYEIPKDTFAMIPDADLAHFEYFNRLGARGNLFAHRLVIPPLTAHLRERFGDLDVIGLRGTACIVDMSGRILLPNSDALFKSPVEILREGVENGGTYAPMTGFMPRDEGLMAEINHRTVQWVIEHPQQLRKEMKDAGYAENDIANVFPLLLVYDRSKFPEGSTTLPNDPEERKKCILAAFILDYPLPQAEVLK